MTSKDTEVSVRVTEFPECREINAHAHTVRTRPSPAFWEGPGYEATPDPVQCGQLLQAPLPLSTCTVIMGHCLQSVVGVAHSSVCIVTMCTAAVMSQCVMSCHRPTQYTRHVYTCTCTIPGGESRVHTNPPQAYSISLLALNQTLACKHQAQRP